MRKIGYTIVNHTTVEKSINAVRNIFSKHDYIMTTAQLDSYRIYYANIQQLLNDGFIEKIKWGYYHWVETNGEQEVKIINRLFPDAVLCMETALFYYQYSDRTICDVLRNMNKMDKEIFNKAIQGYVKDPKKKYTESDGVCQSIANAKKSKRIDWSVVVMADAAASAHRLSER